MLDVMRAKSFQMLTAAVLPFARVVDRALRRTARARGLALLVAMVAALVGAVMPQPAIAQGRPDIVWMRGGHPFSVEAVAYSPNGALVASGYETIKLWRASDGMLTRTLTGQADVKGLAFSPDGQFLASAGDERNVAGTNVASVRVWNVNDGSLAQTLSAPRTTTGAWGSGAKSVAFSPDSQLIAATADNARGLRVWRVSDGAVVLDDENFGGGVAFSPDGQYIAATTVNFPQALHIIRVSDGVASMVTSDPSGGSVAFVRGGAWVATVNGLGLRAYRIADGASVTLLSSGEGIVSLSVSADGQYLAAGGDGFDNRTSQLQAIAYVWRVSDFAQLTQLYPHLGGRAQVALSPDGAMLATSGGAGLGAAQDNSVKLWRSTDGTFLRQLTVYHGLAMSAAITIDGQYLVPGVAALSYDVGDPLTFWNTSGGTPAFSMAAACDYGQTSVVVAPDSGTFLETTPSVIGAPCDATVHLRRASDGAVLWGVDAREPVAFSPDGQTVVTVDSSRGAQLRGAADGTLLRTIGGALAAFSPDGRLLATASGGTLALWNPATGECIRDSANQCRTKAISSPGVFAALAFAPDGQQLAGGGGYSGFGDILLWNLANDTTRSLTGHTDFVQAVAFAPDGSVLASAGRDYTLRFWRVSDGAMMRVYDQETGNTGNVGQLGITGIAFTPDGAQFGYSRWDATIVMARNPFAPTPVASVSPSALVFASQTVGTTSAAQSVTVTNTGSAVLVVTSVSIGGTDPGDFTRTTTCATLAPGGSCTISVAFRPTAPGARSATLSIADNTAASPHPVALSGTATAAPAGEIITATATAVIQTDRKGNRIANWTISGTTSVLTRHTMSITLTRTGTLIGTAATDKNGRWSLSAKNSKIVPVPGDTIRVTSSGGATQTFSVTIQ